MTTTVSSRSGFEVPTAGPETRGIVRMLFAGDIQPAIRILPHYPDKEFRRGKEGRVVIEFTILSNGQVGLLRLIESSGESFAEAAGQSMSSVLFQPRYAGQVIRVEVQFMILRTDTSD
jgi:TonB family protein